MVDRITRLDRRIGIVIVIVAVVLIMSLVLWLVTSIMGGDEPAGGGTGGAEDWMQPLPGELGPDGQPIITQADIGGPGGAGHHGGHSPLPLPRRLPRRISPPLSRRSWR